MTATSYKLCILNPASKVFFPHYPATAQNSARIQGLSLLLLLQLRLVWMGLRQPPTIAKPPVAGTTTTACQARDPMMKLVIMATQCGADQSPILVNECKKQSEEDWCTFWQGTGEKGTLIAPWWMVIQVYCQHASSPRQEVSGVNHRWAYLLKNPKPKARFTLPASQHALVQHLTRVHRNSAFPAQYMAWEWMCMGACCTHYLFMAAQG